MVNTITVHTTQTVSLILPFKELTKETQHMIQKTKPLRENVLYKHGTIDRTSKEKYLSFKPGLE